MIDLQLNSVTTMLAGLPDGCASLVVTDPPWAYRNYGDTLHGAAGAYYDGLSEHEISSHLRAAHRIAAESAYLAVWVTFPKLEEWISHFNVFNRRGMWEYITGGAWGKTNGLGVGYHFRGDAELVLLYKKGAPKPLATTSNLWLAPRIGHSEKPQKALRALVSMAVPPGGLVVDLYAGASASMAIACRSLGRNYVGAEIDPQRHAQALRRLSQQEMVLEELTA